MWFRYALRNERSGLLNHRKEQKMDSAVAESIFITLYSLLTLWHEIHIRRFQLGVAHEARRHFHADPIEGGRGGVDAC